MQFDEYSVPDMAEVVESIWTLDSGGGAAPEVTSLVPTDGCVELVLCLDGTSVEIDRRSGSGIAPDCRGHGPVQIVGGRRPHPRLSGGFALGIATGPLELHHTGPVKLLGIRLRPRGAVGLFGNDLRSLIDRALPLDDVLPGIFAGLREAVDRAGAHPGSPSASPAAASATDPADVSATDPAGDITAHRGDAEVPAAGVSCAGARARAPATPPGAATTVAAEAPATATTGARDMTRALALNLHAGLAPLAERAARPLRGHDERVARALTLIDRARGRMSIVAAAEQVAFSTRQLDRCFERWLGLTPKTFCRIARFRAAWSRGFAAPDLDWATIALDCGYADQAHLCREFREFSGMTPRETRFFG